MKNIIVAIMLAGTTVSVDSMKPHPTKPKDIETTLQILHSKPLAKNDTSSMSSLKHSKLLYRRKKKDMKNSKKNDILVCTDISR